MPHVKQHMKLAIGFSGEGWGHATRIAALSRALDTRNTLFFAPTRVHEFFKTSIPSARMYPLPLLRLDKKNNRIRIIKTIQSNLPAIRSMHRTINTIRTILQEERVEGVISDYDPFTAIAAHKERIPLAYFNHQGIIDKHPSKRLSAILARMTNRIMMPYNKPRIISSYYNGDVGPLIRKELLNKKHTAGSHILIYLKQTLNSVLLPALNQQDEHFEFYPRKNGDFTKSLTSCRGIIAAAGHQTISEALHLGKPILAIPEKNQYEQELNAHMLEKTGRGMSSTIAELPTKIPLFLSMLDQFPLQNDIAYTSEDSTHQAAALILEALDRQQPRASCDQTTAASQKTDRTSSHRP